MWNPFEDVYNFVSGAVGDFFDIFESGASRRQEGRSDAELLLSNIALQNQMSHDAWARQFSEKQASMQEQAFNKQYELARSPISTLVQNGASVGVNPMAALGQNVGSASYSNVSAPGSSVSSPATPNAGSSQNLLGGLTNILGSLLGTKMSTESSKAVAEIQAETTKEIAGEEIESNEKIAKMEDDFKRDELENTKQFQSHQVAKMNVDSQVALQGMNIKEGELELEKQKRLDKLFEDLSARSQRERGLQVQYEQLELKRKDLKRAISADNKQLAGKIFGSICVLAGSILGGPVGAVAGSAVAAFINTGSTKGLSE